jgi:hypothetical protein
MFSAAVARESAPGLPAMTRVQNLIMSLLSPLIGKAVP